MFVNIQSRYSSQIIESSTVAYSRAGSLDTNRFIKNKVHYQYTFLRRIAHQYVIEYLNLDNITVYLVPKRHFFKVDINYEADAS